MPEPDETVDYGAFKAAMLPIVVKVLNSSISSAENFKAVLDNLDTKKDTQGQISRGQIKAAIEIEGNKVNSGLILDPFLETFDKLSAQQGQKSYWHSAEAAQTLDPV